MIPSGNVSRPLISSTSSNQESHSHSKSGEKDKFEASTISENFSQDKAAKDFISNLPNILSAPPPPLSSSTSVSSTSAKTESSQKGLNFRDHIATIISKSYSIDSRNQESNRSELNSSVPSMPLNPYMHPYYPMSSKHVHPSKVLEGIAASVVSMPENLAPHEKLESEAEWPKSSSPSKSKSISNYNIEPISPPAGQQSVDSSDLPSSLSSSVSKPFMPSPWLPLLSAHLNLHPPPPAGMFPLPVPYQLISSMTQVPAAAAGAAAGSRPGEKQLFTEYVRNRIEEVMRTTSEETSTNDDKDRQALSDKVLPTDTPSNINDEEQQSHESSTSNLSKESD